MGNVILIGIVLFVFIMVVSIFAGSGGFLTSVVSKSKDTMYSGEGISMHITFLKDFNNRLLNGTLKNGEAYKGMQELINKCKTLDKSKIIPYAPSGYFNLTPSMEPYWSGSIGGVVFMDDKQNLRFALNHYFVKEPSYIEHCMTLDEIENKVPFREYINMVENNAFTKKQSEMELAKITR